jgi:hypothetical protein
MAGMTRDEREDPEHRRRRMHKLSQLVRQTAPPPFTPPPPHQSHLCTHPLTPRLRRSLPSPRGTCRCPSRWARIRWRSSGRCTARS